jgi:alkaline phosphatase D
VTRPRDRRTFLSDLSRYAFFCAGVPNVWRVTGHPGLQADPFTLGVGSGDPLQDRCVIWTRLAPDPLQPMGGMDGIRTILGWEVAHDEGFSRIVREGRYTAAPELGYSVHVDVDGLEPEREYFYRFTLQEGSSPVGRLRTAPAPGSRSALEMAVASCQHWEQGLFTAFDHMAREDLHLVAHLGDYIYEYAGAPGRVRMHHGNEIMGLDDYRARYAQYRSDPALQAAHALCPWVVTWDDHEVDNNYAGLVGENIFESREQMRNRRAAAYQAWWENQAVRVPRPDSWADLTIRRSFSWGSLARFWVLDTRQYRDDQACGDGNQVLPCGDQGDRRRTLLGEPQERWLTEGLGVSEADWQVLAQQIMVGPFDRDPGPGTSVSMDQWSGYPAARERLLGAVAERAANRTVVLTGDIHSNWVNELHAGFDRPDRPVVAAEFVTTSISSGGDGQEQFEGVAAALPDNPHIRWQNSQRGYLRCSVTQEEWRSDYRIVPFVTRPGAPVHTASSWTVERGKPGIRPG